MFPYFAVLLVLALGKFGAVETHSYLFVQIAWIAALLTLTAHRVILRGVLELRTAAYLVVSGVAIMIDPKLSLACLALGWGWLSAKETPLRIVSFLRFLIVIGLMEATLGLVQYFIAPGWIFGYQNAFYNSTGTFINRNHFAGFLEMVIPATIALAFAAIVSGRDMARAYSLLFVGAFLSIALVFSTSRMGLFACLLTLCFLGGVLRLKTQRNFAAILALVVVGLMVSGALWIGIDVLIQRFGEFTEDPAFQNGRAVVYADTLRMISSHPFGIGPNSFADIFRQYQSFRLDLLIDHAHNDYLETTAEWGILPAVLFWLLVLTIFGRAVLRLVRTQSVERATILIASCGAVFSILLHSLTDFNLQIPSNSMLFFLFLGIAAQASSRGPFPGAKSDAAS